MPCDSSRQYFITVWPKLSSTQVSIGLSELKLYEFFPFLVYGTPIGYGTASKAFYGLWR
jgi:hypothetical protein